MTVTVKDNNLETIVDDDTIHENNLESVMDDDALYEQEDSDDEKWGSDPKLDPESDPNPY